MKQLLSFLTIFIFSLNASIAEEKEAIVWLAKDTSLLGYKQIELQPVSNETGGSLDSDVIALMTQTIHHDLESAGLVIQEPNGSPRKNVIIIKNSLVKFLPGNVGGRWVGFGQGATICVLRSIVFEGGSGEIVAEIISAKVVDVGGLFSYGSEKYVPKDVAKRTAEEVAKLVGVQVPSEEEE